ncbi:MAG: hypothetical protein PHY94_04370 [Candidatus Omnitrophica bacterium]|nr:hypothetical protein [Candidatus Omnitrophota bacterium]
MRKKLKEKKWIRPLLTVLTKDDNREQVLQACKGGGTVEISGANNTCIRLGGAGVACTRCANIFNS